MTTKTPSKKRTASQKPKENPNEDSSYLKIFTAVVKEVGIPGFIVVFLAFIFVIYGTKTQKEEFIDKFLLLKNAGNESTPAAFIITFLVFILILGAIYHVKALALEREEIRRIGEEKSMLQEQLIQKRLRSSNK
jgi:hypothetical protein